MSQRAAAIARRRLLAIAGQSALALPAVLLFGCTPSKEMASRETPIKPLLTLNVRALGAAGDGVAKDTVALQQTIDRCAVLGGGEVLVPAGTYLVGALQLRSRVTLRLEEGASLVGTPDFNDYPISQVRWEGRWRQGHLALLYAIDADDVAIIGPGSIIGNPALGGRPNAQNPLRHPALIEFIRCKNIRLEDFSTRYHLMWSIHPTDCENIAIRNLIIRSTGGNGDGIDLDSCRDVLIADCDIATGDDCISLKSGRGSEALTLLHTTENVHITGCTFADSNYACIGIGSEASGGIRNVRIEHCKFVGAKTHAIYIKSKVGRGAFIENITADDLDVSGVMAGFLRLNATNSGIQDEFPVAGLDGIPSFKNFKFSNIRVADCPVLVEGTELHPLKPLDGLSLARVSGTCGKGIFLANMVNVSLEDVRVSGYVGALLNTANVTGRGLEDAASLDPPMPPDVIQPSSLPFHLQ